MNSFYNSLQFRNIFQRNDWTRKVATKLQMLSNKAWFKPVWLLKYWKHQVTSPIDLWKHFNLVKN